METVAMNVEKPFIPHEVVELVIRQDLPLIRAWRHYMGMTVEELARISGLKTYEVEQLEAEDNAFSSQLEKVAAGLQLDIDQLIDL